MGEDPCRAQEHYSIHSKRLSQGETMHRSISTVVAVLGLAVLLAPSAFARDQHCLEFSELIMTLERNATDGDTEVVLFAQGQDDGLKRLVIRAPNGRRVAEFKGDERGIG